MKDLTSAQRTALRHLAARERIGFCEKHDGGRESTYSVLCQEGLARHRTVKYQRYVRNGGFGADYYTRTEYVSEYEITPKGRTALDLD